MTTFGVITKVPDNNAPGNLASGMGSVFLDPQMKGGNFDDYRSMLGVALGIPLLDLYIQVPVFTLGELLIIGGDDRDQFTRKPSKWDVTCETFDNIEDAVARVREVTTHL